MSKVQIAKKVVSLLIPVLIDGILRYMYAQGTKHLAGVPIYLLEFGALLLLFIVLIAILWPLISGQYQENQEKTKVQIKAQNKKLQLLSKSIGEFDTRIENLPSEQANIRRAAEKLTEDINEEIEKLKAKISLEIFETKIEMKKGASGVNYKILITTGIYNNNPGPLALTAYLTIGKETRETNYDCKPFWGASPGISLSPSKYTEKIIAFDFPFNPSELEAKLTCYEFSGAELYSKTIKLTKFVPPEE